MINPLRIFDYIYFSIAYLYAKKFGYKDVKEFSGISILSLFQLFNILFLFDHIKLLKDLAESKNEKIAIFILGYFLFFGLNILRYKKIITYYELDNRWGKERGIRRIIKVVFVCFYIFLSIYLLGLKCTNMKFPCLFYCIK